MAYSLITDNLFTLIFVAIRYTRQVIDETLRASVLAPWGARVHDFDLQVGEYVIPKEVYEVLFKNEQCVLLLTTPL